MITDNDINNINNNQSATTTIITLTKCLKDGTIEAGKDLASMFYLMPVHETIKDDIYDVTNYEVKVRFIFLLIISINCFVLIIEKKPINQYIANSINRIYGGH